MNKKHWYVIGMGAELLEYFQELNEEQIFNMVSSLITKVYSFPGLNKDGKFIFLELLEHSLRESRLNDDIDEYNYQVTEKKRVRNHFKYSSLRDYERDIYLGEFYRLVDSEKPWMIGCFMTSLVTTEKLSYSQKAEAIEMMYAIIMYAKDQEPNEFTLKAL